MTRDAATGHAVLSTAKRLAVPKYKVPADAAQPGTDVKLETFDARPGHVVSAIDPSRGTGSSVALWTQHTVLGGAGAEVRWYEIDPVTTTLFHPPRLAGRAGHLGRFGDRRLRPVAVPVGLSGRRQPGPGAAGGQHRR